MYANLKNNVAALMPYLFIAFLPTQLGKYSFFDFSYVNGVAIDYLAISVFFIDILFLLLCFFYQKDFKKILKAHGKTILFIALLTALSIGLAHAPLIALWKGWVLLESMLLFFFFSTYQINVSKLLWTLIISTAAQLILCLLQVSFGSSIQGIFYFLGERLLSINTPSIAKVTLFDHELLRAYGTFSHPNSMGGFYGLLFIFILSLKRNIREIKVLYLLLGLFFALVLLSFSKLVIVGVLMTTVYQFVGQGKKSWTALLILSLCGGIVLLAQGDTLSYMKRLEGMEATLQIIRNHIFLGVGLGQHLYALSSYPTNYTYFFLQPVHNVFLLLASELGLPVVLLLTVRLWKYLHTKTQIVPVILFITITSLGDHYWYTLHQNILLLAAVLGISIHFISSSLSARSRFEDKAIERSEANSAGSSF